MIEHRAHPKFWESLHVLPVHVQDAAKRAFQLMEGDPFHPSLHLKQVGDYWSARAGLHYRALARRTGDIFTWFWIGPHHVYDRLIS